MPITKINEIYIKDISEKVKGVILAGQKDADTVYTELEEFVITKELHKHINNFFQSFNDVNDNKKDNIGAWISGFFGSGKSHLLKIISYLLENKEVKGKTPLEFFNEKLKDDQMLLGDITRAVNSNADVILFNIDSKASKNSKNNKDGILEVFVKVFNEKLGYCSDIPWLAEFEHELFMEGKYEEYKEKYKEVSGKDWIEERDSTMLSGDNIVKTLIEGKFKTENDSIRWLENNGKDYNMSVSKFAELIKKYSAKKGNDHKVIFLVDEIGQYIGSDTSLMLNLQTLVEDLGKELLGKAWVIVTSQEAIDSITEIRGHDFSKIQGRFPTRLTLSSENTDEVIKKRLLEKTKEAEEQLEVYYIKNEDIIKNLFSFSSATADMKLYIDEKDFGATYPFVPYQFNLLQKVFEKIRVIGVAGSHIADGNRSMLNGYQEAGSSILDEDIGTLIPFSSFYNTIESFLSGEIKRTINQTKDNAVLETIDTDVLKVLFMIRYVEQVPCDIENLTTLLISNIDENKQQLRANIKKSLDRLISQTLIYRNGDEYLFLDNEEQTSLKEINAESIDPTELLKQIGEITFGEFYKNRKYSYSKFNNYYFNQLVDDYQHLFPKQHSLVIKISTSLSDKGDSGLFYSEDHALGEIKLYDDSELLSNLTNLKKIEKWIRKNNNINETKRKRDIINDKSKEIEDIKARIKKLLEDSIKKGTILINGKELESIKTGSSVYNLFEQILNKLVENSYKNVSWITKHYDIDEIIKILKINNIEEQTLINVDDNKNAIDDIRDYVALQTTRGFTTTFKMIIDKYTTTPYGWNEIDIAGIVANLFITGDVQFEYNDEVLHKGNDYISGYITKFRDFEKLVVKTKKQIDRSTILNVKNIIQDCFDETDLSDNEEELFNNIKNIFISEQDKLNKIGIKFLTDNYPVKNIFEISNDDLRKYINITDSSSLFKYIIENKEEIENLEKDIRTIGEFFSSQVTIYDDAKSKLKFYEDEFNLFSGDDMEDINLNIVDELKTILNSSSPYKQIKNIPSLLLEIKQGYEKVLENKKSDVLSKLDIIISDLENEITKNNLSDEFKTRIIGIFTSIKDGISTEVSCKNLMALNLSEKNLNANRQIINEVNRLIDEKNILNSSRSGEKEIPKEKKQVPVEIDTIVEKGIIIESSEDIDDYTDKINKLLKKKLDSGDKIRII